MAKSSAETRSEQNINNIADSFNTTTNNVTSFTDSGNITLGAPESAAALNLGGFGPVAALGGAGVLVILGLVLYNRRKG